MSENGIPEAEPEPGSGAQPGASPETEPERRPEAQPETKHESETEQPEQHESPAESHPVTQPEPLPAPELYPAAAEEPAPELSSPAEQPAPEVAPGPKEEPAPEVDTEPRPAPNLDATAPSIADLETAEMLESVATTEAPAAGSEPEAPVGSSAQLDGTPARSGPSPLDVARPAAAPRPALIPTPAALAKVAPRPPAAAAPPPITTDHSASAAFGRVDEHGTVFVRTKDGEREVGSYPGASHAAALTYFARRYDELYASAVLLEQRLAQPEVPSKDVQEGLKALTAQVQDAAVVGDLEALATKVDEIQSGLAAKRLVEQQHRAEARGAAKAERERIVAEAESIAAQPENRIQWKSSGARMRELLDEWKAHQRSSTRLDRGSETDLWQRFSAARNRFDKARRTHFADLDATHADVKAAKERLVSEAEKLATSTDWAATAGAFKRLMDEWRGAGRASRAEDDQLWARFKTAQDSFFTAKDALVAEEEGQFRGNLRVKEGLLKEAQAILPVTDTEKAKARLREIQDRWEAAGKVPRADMERVEKAMRRIEQTVRDADDKRWTSSNPEVAARARAMVEQLERAVSGLEDDLAKAELSGNESAMGKAREALAARQAWLDQARAGVAEFGG